MARFEQSALALFESILYASVIPPAAFYQIVVFFDMNPKERISSDPGTAQTSERFSVKLLFAFAVVFFFLI